MKGTTGRYEELGTPSWAVLLAAVLAMAVGVSLAHPGAASRAHPRTAQAQADQQKEGPVAPKRRPGPSALKTEAAVSGGSGGHGGSVSTYSRSGARSYRGCYPLGGCRHAQPLGLTAQRP